VKRLRIKELMKARKSELDGLGGADFEGFAEGFQGELGDRLFCILPSERKCKMVDQEKITRPVKLNQEEVAEELVNDSLGEVTPADSTGLDSKDEARKRERPA